MALLNDDEAANNVVELVQGVECPFQFLTSWRLISWD